MSFKTLKYFVYADYYRLNGDHINLNKLIKNLFLDLYPGFKYIFFFRICSFLYSNKSKFRRLILKIFSFKLRKLQYKFGIEIPYTTKIEEGLLIPHFGNITINSNAKIGKNCTILQGVTIGNDLFKSRNSVAIIGDNVFIGSGAKIIGPCTIGNNVTIGANAVVTKDIPENSVVGGIPARVISYKKSIVLNSEYNNRNNS